MSLIRVVSIALTVKCCFNFSNRGIIDDIVTLLSEESFSPHSLNGFKSLIIEFMLSFQFDLILNLVCCCFQELVLLHLCYP